MAGRCPSTAAAGAAAVGVGRCLPAGVVCRCCLPVFAGGSAGAAGPERAAPAGPGQAPVPRPQRRPVAAGRSAGGAGRGFCPLGVWDSQTRPAVLPCGTRTRLAVRKWFFLKLALGSEKVE